MLFEVYLVRKGWISPAQLIDAIERQARSFTPLGQLAIEMRKLTMKQAFHVLTVQAETDQPFGRVATELGYMSEEDLAMLLMTQRDRAPSIGKLLVASGAISGERMQAEMQTFRRELASRSDSSDQPGDAPAEVEPLS